MQKHFHIFMIFYILFTLSNTLFAYDKENIPSALKDWEAWVLDDIKDLECPIHYQKNERVCSWPNEIDIKILEKQIDFNLTWQLFKDNSKITLPTNREYWPYNVKVNGKKSIVLDKDNSATLILNKGSYDISGSFSLDKNIKYLQLPKNIAIVNLYKNGQKVSDATVDKNGRLWFVDKSQKSKEKGSVEVSIYRKIVDAKPLKMQTYLHLRVSGKTRNITLDAILLDGFLPLSIKSDLDATLTKNRKLQLEVKAGEWIVLVDSYNPKQVSKLQKPKSSFKYSNEEIWVFKADPNYRTLKIKGVSSIDPSQTNLHLSWKNLPAFLMRDETQMTLKELYKNEQSRQRNNLFLQRELWLDFDGDGYTFLDNITAKIEQTQRLEAETILNLGSVSINGKPELITTLEKSNQKGIELRESELQIKALSRYDGDIGLLPANGWDEKFTSVNTKLNLPPGWRLFASFGSDDRGEAWLDSWDLMDIFLTLILCIAIYQLYGWKFSFVSTVFLILLWQESNAPTIIWLIILVFIALLRVLDRGSIQKTLKVFLSVSIMIAVWQVLNFGTYELRTALYPQLASHDFHTQRSKKMLDSASSYNEVKKMYKEEGLTSPSPRKNILLENKIDPNAIIQTGSGIPTWQWKTHNFSWQSGVGSDERLELWLISPFINKILSVLKVLGMLFLLYMFLREFIKPVTFNFTKSKGEKDAIKIAVLLILISSVPNSLKADIPTPKLLSQLKEKLTAKPECLPNCAQYNKVIINTTNDTLKIELEISAGENVSVPVLGNRDVWLPELVRVNEKNFTDLRLDDDGHLWIKLSKGVHKVELLGSIKDYENIILSSLLPLNNILNSHKDSWEFHSDNRSFIKLKNLDFQINKEQNRATSIIKPLIQIERTFRFGLHFYIDTRVRVLNTIDKPYTLNYTLLEGESILDKDIEVKNQTAIIYLQNEQSDYHWRSTLPLFETLELVAGDKNNIIESWKIDATSLWNIRYEGISPIEQLKVANLILPHYKPWQKEKLTLFFEKSKAVKGDSLTIERSDLKVVQSQNYRDISLNLKINSSTAQQYILTLENIDELKSATIDNKTHYFKTDQGKITIPLQAKMQEIELKWREKQSSLTNYTFTNINLNQPSVNNNITLELPRNRWILWTSGPILGPGVLLWGVILALLLFSIILGKSKISPLKIRDWFLLGLGVSTTSIMIMLPIVVWVLALKYRLLYGDTLQRGLRNLLQVGLIILTFITLLTIISALSFGLLGSPDMMVSGNNSFAYNLNWYSDRIGDTLPEPTVISVSIWYYRALMLLWAVWISFSLISWLKWAWDIFSKGGIWIKKKPKILDLPE